SHRPFWRHRHRALARRWRDRTNAPVPSDRTLIPSVHARGPPVTPAGTARATRRNTAQVLAAPRERPCGLCDPALGQRHYRTPPFDGIVPAPPRRAAGTIAGGATEANACGSCT